ncbi:cadherin-like protein 26 isoform X3 [Dendropsophus ebraccatus]|uniref:cadherin-like protein 26 isoform X3 n=1 Tax=Dendropsophus ebraccatus TaxID=150705 RepID=UPI0038315096
MRTVYPLLILLLLVVIASLGERPKKAVQRRLQRTIPRNVQHSGHVLEMVRELRNVDDVSDSHRPLRRSKRRWVLTTIVLDENDPGPFPKYAGDLFNDRSINHSIRYLISGPGVDEAPEIGLFQINDVTGQVFVNRAIDREETSLFIIRFDAADRTTGKILDRSLIFNVEVNDMNDNAPVFDNSTYNVVVKETGNLDNAICQVTAIDHDKQDTPNSKVSYYFVKQIPDIPNVKFSIDPNNGLVFGKGCLNYMTANMIRLIVGARDAGVKPMASTATINIRLEDGNNNMPVFITNKYNLTVREGESGNDILRFKVEDKDTPKTSAWKAKYKILSGNDKENYNVLTDPETNEGIFNIIKPLDYEGTPTKTVVISVENEEPLYTCQSNKMKIATSVTYSNATISITVIDSNDAPVFVPAKKTVWEKEGVKAGTILVTYNASDPDKVPNKIKYKIAEDPAGWVTIDENTGVLKTTQELDRESPYVNETLYTVVVYAIDDGEPPATGSGTINLYVSDINDNTPEIKVPYVERCEKQSSEPFTIEATDRDLDPYAGPFKIEVVADHSKRVNENWNVKQISDNSAEISMVRSLNTGNYSIPLEIYDRQGSYSERVLNIRVCSCIDGQTCERVQPAAYHMGGGAIGAIIGALLIFLLALCFLMCFLCGSGGNKNNKFPANDEGNQTLIQYNEEGGSVLSQASPAVLLANGNGNGIIDLASKDKEAVGRTLSNLSGAFPRAQYQAWEADGAGRAPRGQYQSNEMASPAVLLANGKGNRIIDLASKDKEAVGRTLSNLSGAFPRAQYQAWEADGAGRAPRGQYQSNEMASPAVLLANGKGNRIIDLASKDKEAVGRTLSNLSGAFPRAQYQAWEADGAGRAPRGQYQSNEMVGAGIVGSASKNTGQGQTWVQGNQTMQGMNGTWHQGNQIMQGQNGTWQQGNLTMQSQNGTWHQNSKYMKNGSLKIRHEHVFVERIGEMLGQRLQGFKGEDETYKPRTYAYEGDLERIDSMDSFTFPDNNMDFSFLDDFDPKFSALEAICKQ